MFRSIHDGIYSRDVEGSVGPEVGGSYPEALLDLIRASGTIVLNVAVLGLDVVGVEVGDSGDIRVGNLAVIALVIVVGQDLPVEFALHIPGVIKLVLLEVVVLESGLLIDSLKVIRPSDLRGLAGIQVDPDEAILVKVNMNGDEVTVESLDISFVVLCDDELVTSSVIFDTITSVRNAMLVGREEPLSRED
jgi:hypothetical protein